MPEQIPEILQTAIVWIVGIVGAASMLVAAVEKITDITPTTKDDEVVGKIKRAIGKVVALLDRLALNPDESKARRSKE